MAEWDVGLAFGARMKVLRESVKARQADMALHCRDG